MTENPETPETPPEKPAEPYEFPPERPLECSECKKPIAVHYTGIVGKTIVHTLMCADCPFLQQHLKGIPIHTNNNNTVIPANVESGLCCGNCGTTLESIRMGNTVGCSACYEIFADVLVSELQSSNKLPTRLSPANKKSSALHLGRSPGETGELTPSVKLVALNEALMETLKLEDYEQAALLRDQIRELTDTEKKAKSQSQKNGHKQRTKDKEGNER